MTDDHDTKTPSESNHARPQGRDKGAPTSSDTDILRYGSPEHIPIDKRWIMGIEAQRMIGAGDLRTFKAFARRHEIRVRKFSKRKRYSTVDIMKVLI